MPLPIDCITLTNDLPGSINTKLNILGMLIPTAATPYVAIIILSTYITAELFNFSNSTIIEFTIQVVVVTFILLLLGEVIPKVFANQKSLLFASLMSRPLYILSKILYPINKILVSSSTIIEKKFKNKGYKISIDELSTALEIAGDNDTNEDEKRILKSIVQFGNIDVKQIMKSRIDIISIEESFSFNKIKSIIISSGYFLFSSLV